MKVKEEDRANNEDDLIERLKAESKDAIDFFLKLGELMERGEVEVKLIVKRKKKP